MNKLIFFILLGVQFSNINAQNYNPATFTLPENATAKDYAFLKEELKNVQVVMLGERTHFDGNVFEAKTEIVKYLHQEMGFNTIAFESGIYDVWKAQEDIKNGGNVKTAFEQSLFPIWTRTNEFQSFITFFDANKSALKVFGFDNQITGTYGETILVTDLFSYCSQNQLTLKLNRDDLELLIESMNNSGVFDETDITYGKFRSALTHLLDSMSKKPDAPIHFYWRQTIKSLLAIAEYSRKNAALISTFETSADDNIRDQQMADNLLAYIKIHPGEKIICWGANAHFVNNMTSVKASVIKEYIPMGSYIKKALQEKVYSLASVTAADSIYLNKTWNKTPIKKASLEQLLKDKNAPHLFISSNQDAMKHLYFTRLFSPIDFIEARPDELHDGYLYFNHTKPATLIEAEENLKKTTDKNGQSPNSESRQTTQAAFNEKSLIAKEAIQLDEVLIPNYSKKHTYSIISKAIENIAKNYPTNYFTSQQYSIINVGAAAETTTNFEFTNKQFDRGYNQTERNTKQLEAIKWNMTGDYKPTNIRQFRSLTYNNPIMYSSCFNSRKSKKFVYKINEVVVYNNKAVYVIDFSIPRNHYTFTKRQNPGNYSGTLYINKDDFAVVKITEHWEFSENPEQSKYDTYGWNEKYLRKEVRAENIETHFSKINNLYFLTSSEIELSGKLFDKEQLSTPFDIYIQSNWSDFKTDNPVKISFKDEIELFGKVKFEKLFWDGFSIPK